MTTPCKPAADPLSSSLPSKYSPSLYPIALPVRVAGVPEHFNFPWHIAKERGLFIKHNVDVSVLHIGPWDTYLLNGTSLGSNLPNIIPIFLSDLKFHLLK